MSKTLPPASAPTPLEATPAVELFMEKHFKSLTIAIALVAVALIGYGVVRYSKLKKAEEAGAALVAAKTVVDYDLVIQNYPGSEAAGNALLLKADVLWGENKKDSSVATLREFVSKQNKHPFYAQSLVALAAKLESMGERAEAKPLFERVINEFPDSEVAPLAQIRVGDILWADGKEEEAKKAYESLPAKFANADSAFINESEDRLKWVEAKLPTKEVDGPPKPKVVEPAPGAGPVDKAAIQDMLKMKLNSGGLSPTISPDAGGTAPMIQLQPTPSGATPPKPAPPITVAPPVLKPATPPAAAPTAPATPKPAATPAPAPTPTPAAAPAVSPAPSTSAPAVAPVSATPAPAPTATPAAAPAAPVPVTPPSAVPTPAPKAP